jgi:hypothetical protein
MKPLINHPVKVFVTGFIVLLFLSLSLFWIRFACETSLVANMPHEARQMFITPSGLVPSEIENDPNVIHHSSGFAYMRPAEPDHLGIIDYFTARFPGGRCSNVYLLNGNDKWIYFDKKLGLLVCRYTQTKKTPDNKKLIVYIECYIGPEGFATIPNKNLGRFAELVINQSEVYSYWQRFSQQIIYDKKLRQFFKIDFDKQTVTKGPKLDKNDSHNPIQIGRPQKNTYSILRWEPPQVSDPDFYDKNPARSRGKYKPVISFEYNSDAGPYLLVLDKYSRIYLLDKESLEFVGTAGRLPDPKTYFGSERLPIPKNLLSYDVQSIALNKYYLEDGSLHKMVFNGRPSLNREASKVESEYLGLFTSSISRNGTTMALAVFNAEGKLIRTQDTKTIKYDKHGREEYTPSGKAIFWETPWAPFTTIIKYSVENLHPPILSLASYFTAHTFEAASGQRALFLLPNSFIAMIGRDHGGNFAERSLTALWWILPSIILSIILARRVAKDAIIVGLSKNAKTCWIIGTIAFGLTAYITYKLTKPKITLVTCQNCGKPRRPDMEKCHRCKSDWHVPELTPPLWRVIE